MSKDFVALIEEMKIFYNANSIEEVAKKMGYSPASVTNWRRKKALSTSAIARYEKDKKKAELKQSANAHVIVHYYPNVTRLDESDRIIFDEGYTDITLPPFFEIFNNENSLCAIKARGDTFAPYINNGELAIIERISHANNGNIVIASISKQIYIAPIAFHPLGKWTKLLTKDTIELQESDMKLLKIIGVLRLVITSRIV